MYFNCFFTLFMINQNTVTKCNSQTRADLCDAIRQNGSIVKLVTVYKNLNEIELVEEAIKNSEGKLGKGGSLIVFTGEKTGDLLKTNMW